MISSPSSQVLSQRNLRCEFVAELDERVRRYEAGTDPAFSVEEARSSLSQMKKVCPLLISSASA